MSSSNENPDWNPVKNSKMKIYLVYNLIALTSKSLSDIGSCASSNALAFFVRAFILYK